MRVKKVPLQDLELWPDEVICFTAYTDTRNPVQQRRTYVDGTRYAELQAENEKLRKKINALKAHGIEIVDAVAGGYEIYDTSQREVDRLEVENGKLREALCSAWKCAHAGISCSDCRLIAGGCTLQSAMCELGIEVK